MKKYLQLLRVKSYIKNALIILPFVFSGKFLTLDGNYLKVFIGITLFCLSSSLIYIFNDLIDRKKDQLHPQKRNRPLASGVISPKVAYIFMAVLLIIIAGGLAWFNNLQATIWICVYIFLNVLYSLFLKNIPILDIALLSSFFIIRIYFGGSLINVTVSSYLHLTIMSVAFLMGANKRNKEKNISADSRGSLAFYSSKFLTKISQVFLGLSIVFYSLWVLSDTNTLINKTILLISIMIVVLILLYYQYLVDSNEDGNPVDVFLSNPLIIVLSLIYCAILFVGFLLQ